MTKTIFTKKLQFCERGTILKKHFWQSDDAILEDVSVAEAIV